jgi:hypothetical protein
MACGSGRLVADLVTGHPGAIRSDDLGLARYGGRVQGPPARPRTHPAAA